MLRPLNFCVFAENAFIKEIKMPDTVKGIGYKAFFKLH